MIAYKICYVHHDPSNKFCFVLQKRLFLVRYNTHTQSKLLAMVNSENFYYHSKMISYLTWYHDMPLDETAKNQKH